MTLLIGIVGFYTVCHLLAFSYLVLTDKFNESSINENVSADETQTRASYAGEKDTVKIPKPRHVNAGLASFAAKQNRHRDYLRLTHRSPSRMKNPFSDLNAEVGPSWAAKEKT